MWDQYPKGSLKKKRMGKPNTSMIKLSCEIKYMCSVSTGHEFIQVGPT